MQFPYLDALLAFLEPSPLVRLSVVIVTMILIAILFWLDKYYYSLLYGSYVRLKFLETFRVPAIKLSTFSGGFNRGIGKGVLDSIYVGFLIGLLILGLAIIIADTKTSWKLLLTFQHQLGKLLLISTVFVLSGISIGIARKTLYSEISNLDKKIDKIIHYDKKRWNNVQPSKDELLSLEKKIADKLEEYSQFKFGKYVKTNLSQKRRKLFQKYSKFNFGQHVKERFMARS